MSGNTVSSNTRASRSRFSSPQTVANGAGDSASSSSLLRAQGGGGGGGGTNGLEGQKQFMQRWLEPPVQVRASYQDAGLVRHGVVENMAPLGTLPKVGLFRKTAPPPAAAPEHTPVRKIVIKQKPVVPSTPVPAPPSAPEEDETEEDETQDEDGETESIQDRDEDGAQGGSENYKPRTAAAPLRSRHSLANDETDDEDWAPGTPAQKGTGRRSVSRASTGPAQQAAPSSSAGSRQVDQKEFVDKVVEAAVDEALAHFRYPTAWALRTLYDENSSNQEFLDMVQKVFLQTANADTLEEFARLIQAKKKEGKKDNKACYYFVPPSTNSRFTPHKPKRAPYGNLVKFDISTLRLDQDGGGSKSQKRARPAKATAAPPAPEREREEAEPEPEPELPPRKKRKSARQHSGFASSSAARTAASKMATSAKANADTPSRKRTRAHSVSSISSLSSARSLSPPDEIQEEDGEGDGFDEPPSRNSPAPSQPITANRRRRSNAPRKSRNVSPCSRPSPAASASSTTAAPQKQQQAAAAVSTPSQASRRQSPAAEQPAAEPEEHRYEMPAVVDSPLFPNLNSRKGTKAGTPVPVFATKVGKLDPEDPTALLRQKAQKVTSRRFPVSNVRQNSPQPQTQLEEVESPAKPARASRPRTSLPSARPTPGPREGRSTRSSLKRVQDDLEDPLSPTAANFPASEAASTVADSRAGTPVLRAAKKARTGLRVKNSPVKKKNGPSAGIPRPSGERNSPVGNAAHEDDNDDYCSSCGGNGELICCDGCTRSFHFSCVDPPLMRDAMPVEWFCNVCRIIRAPAALPAHEGAFALLFEKLDAKNSSAFRLPGPVRDRFEGVRTGPDGEYEEDVPVVKPARKKKSDEDQVPDFFRLRDAEGNAAICHACQKAASAARAIIPCSVCGTFWHLDCLDPPMAHAPVLRTWKCPLHTEDILDLVPAALKPAHKHRKIKNAPVVRPAFTRGHVNNGYVDIQLDDTENESGWQDVETFGRTVRLSEKGIKLDFLSRVHRNIKEQPAVTLADASAASTPVPMEQRSLDEQRAALNLAQLSGNRGDGVSALIDAMISQADPAVIDLISRVDPSNLEKGRLDRMDHQSLRAVLARAEAMTEHIRRLLASSTTPAQAQAPTQPTAASADAEAEEAPAIIPIPSLTNSASPDADSSTAADPGGAMARADADAATKRPKSLASPAPTDDDDDDVPAMTQGEKTPVLPGDQSPPTTVPLTLPPLEESAAPVAVAGSDGDPVTPTKTTAIIAGNVEPVVLEAESHEHEHEHGHGHGEKTLGKDGGIEI